MRRATDRESIASDARGNRLPQPGRRPDEDHRDAPPRGSPDPRHSPGGPGGERPLTTPRGRPNQPATIRRAPGEQAFDARRDPVATGGDGVLSRLALLSAR